jgi:hypothetical protein
MMAYIGSGDFGLTANKCTGSFVLVFFNLWSTAKMSQSERVWVPSRGPRPAAQREDFRNARAIFV